MNAWTSFTLDMVSFIRGIARSLIMSSTVASFVGVHAPEMFTSYDDDEYAC